MNTKYNLEGLSQRIVYLKPVATADLPANVQAQAGDLETLFAVHNGGGEQVALVSDPAVASHFAAEHKMQLLTVH